MEQTCINFDLAAPSIHSMVDMVRTLLEDGRWWAPHELIEEIWRTRQIKVSEAGITARLRDLRKPAYGSHGVRLRRRQGTNYYEYHLEN